MSIFTYWPDGLVQTQGSCYIYTTFTNFNMKYHLMFKVYTDVGGIK